MRLIRIGVVCLVFSFIASAAGAQCLRCYRETLHSGTCGISDDGFANRACEGAVIGDACPLPDFLDPCDGARASATAIGVLLQSHPLAGERQMPEHFLLTSAHIEAQALPLYRKLGTFKVSRNVNGARTRGRCSA